jgi:hypothetical protein
VARKAPARALRISSFANVRELAAAIYKFGKHWNDVLRRPFEARRQFKRRFGKMTKRLSMPTWIAGGTRVGSSNVAMVISGGAPSRS